MKNRKYLILILLVLIILNVNGQTSVNREWETSYGNPAGLALSSSIITSQGNIVRIGNKLVNGEGANIFVAMIDKYGTSLWQTDYNTSSSFNDYGIVITEDANGDLYVVGTTDNGTNNNSDVIVLKFNTIGNLIWHSTYDSPFNLNDIGTAIKVDDFGNIYVCASSEGTSTMSDFLLLKYNPQGILLWESRYDYNSLVEVPIGIDIDSIGNIFVIGGSANTVLNWDYTIARFSPLGTYLNDVRAAMVGFGYDQPLAYKKDLIGNI